MGTDSSIPQTHFGLATLALEGMPTAALWVDGHYRRLTPQSGLAPGTGVMDLLTTWSDSLPKLWQLAESYRARGGVDEGAIPESKARRLAPLRYPGKILGVALNYGGQLKELGLPPKPFRPLPFFVRPASNTLIGPDEPLYMPEGVGLDWEIEIGAVIGRRMRHVSRNQARAGIAAYAVAVDLTVRDLIAVDNPFKTDLFRSKCQDCLSPIGPLITPAEFIPDPQDLRLTLSINGVTRQDARSSDMLVPIDELISEASRYVTWEPGDLLLTGTPAGTSGNSGVFLKPGDRVHAQIERLGAFEFEVLSRARPEAN
jgi:2-keto-4-pentenoate hydratase/2-oxohepta-3-ene-1,7-dioic acid hydratase in catechol pathway